MLRIPLAAASLLLCILADYTAIGQAASPAPKVVTLIEPVETEYGFFGRGRQMPFVEREGNYVRVRYLDHEVLIPISSTDLRTEAGSQAQTDARKELKEWLAGHGVTAAAMIDEKLIPEAQSDAQKTLEELRKRTARAIQKHRVMIGMTAQECRLALGAPSSVNRTFTETRRSEQWVYPGGWLHPSDRYLYLDDGVLTSVQD
jgi:hypothetical protein